MTQYYDYRYKFLKTGLPVALAALTALRMEGLLNEDEAPTNMLGEPRDETGSVIVPSAEKPATFYGRDGTNGGDPNYWYVSIRTTVKPEDVHFDTELYGLEPCTAEETAAVLGVWE